MPVDFNYFITVAKEFALADPATVSFFLARAAEFLDAKVLGPKYDYMLALLAAHFMKMASPAMSAIGGGAITSSKVGDLQRSFAAPSMSTNSAIGSTSYGRLFLQLRATIPVSPLVVTGCVIV